MHFFSTVLGALALTQGVFANRDLQQYDDKNKVEVNKSSAKCSVVALASGKVTKEEAIAEAAADAAAYVCYGEGTDHDASVKTAKAFAIAVAEASAKCKLEGDAHVHASAKAYAKAEAEIWLEAYASAYASASTCGKCDAYAYSWGYVAKYVFLDAVAHASVKLDAYTYDDDYPLVLKARDYMIDVEKAVATAYAKALAGAAKYYDSEGCIAWVNAGGCIWTEDHGDQCFDCVAHAVSAGAIKEIDAVATAGASAATWTCGKHAVAYADAEASAKAVAKAAALAISYIWASCDIDKDGYACIDVGTHIHQTAHAVAYAYAEIWAGAYTCKDSCYVNIDATAKAIGDILVTACSDAYDYVCSGKGHFQIHDFEAHLLKASVKAIADASVHAISIGDHTCLAGGYVGAEVH